MVSKNSLFGPIDPAVDAGYSDPPPRKGFFTDTSVCIGCKACEVACKEWNLLPSTEEFDLLGMSFDNTGALGSNSWRHVAFIEQPMPTATAGAPKVDLGMPSLGPPGSPLGPPIEAEVEEGDTAHGAPLPNFRWLMSSDVCKHCTHAACLDVCPTGALFRTEFGTVVVQDDVCNGCGYCVAACPYGVIERRREPEGAQNVGIAQKCTLCYDRLGAGMQPACAQACPTDSIQFGDVEELRERAEQRRATLQEAGVSEARLYGHDPNDGVGGTGAFFLLLDEPEVYGLPPDPVVTTRDLPRMFNRAGIAGLGLMAAVVAAFVRKR
ncbi:MAG TPA: 4Fe-4S dicluster domain-containing protein [Actinomycetaceae bacterium]|nr:4Fe-4S dicluster domain-containing protein [Actinomycetaceae bacterium]